MIQLADLPSKTSLIYDVYNEGEGEYSIYIIARYETYSSGAISYSLFEHKIERSGNNRSFVKASLSLDDGICVDEIKATDKLIVLACI